MNTARQIRTRRLALGLPQHEAAKRAGMAQANWCTLEQPGQRQPTIPTLKRVADVLECTVLDLLQ